MKNLDLSESPDAAGCARLLVIVPIMHAPADMGMIAADMAATCIERLGRRHWDEYLALIENFWQEVRAEIERLRLDYRLVDLYQDGLPVCGIELDLVAKASSGGSENYRRRMGFMRYPAFAFCLMFFLIASHYR